MQDARTADSWAYRLSNAGEGLAALWFEDSVFVGGAVVGLLLTDPAAPASGANYNVDVIIGETSLVGYHRFEVRLREAGSPQPMEGPIC